MVIATMIEFAAALHLSVKVELLESCDVTWTQPTDCNSAVATFRLHSSDLSNGVKTWTDPNPRS